MDRKNSHLQAKVTPESIFNALKFLKACGNKHYQTTADREEYEKRCRQEDPDGYNLLFGERGNRSGHLEVAFYQDGAVEPVMELTSYLDMLEMQKLEEEYCEKDTVRKFQLDYNETICMVDKYPEAMQIEGVLNHNWCYC